MLAAVGLTHGYSSAVHNYTQTIQRRTQISNNNTINVIDYIFYVYCYILLFTEHNGHVSLEN